MEEGNTFCVDAQKPTSEEMRDFNSFLYVRYRLIKILLVATRNAAQSGDMEALDRLSRILLDSFQGGEKEVWQSTANGKEN